MLRKGSAVVVALSMVAAAVVVAVDFDATELGQAALARASASSNVKLEASRYRIHLLRGLELEDVEASARVPGARYRVAMPAMRFEHRALSMLLGPLEIHRVVLVEPRIDIVTGLAPPPATPRPRRAPTPRPRRETSPPAEPPAPIVALRVRELELVGGSVDFDDELSLDGVDIRLESPSLASGRLTVLHGLDARGRVEVRELRVGSLEVRDVVVGRLELSSGRLEMADVAFETDAGSFEADIRLDINSIPARYEMALDARVEGVPGRARFRGEGFGLDPRHLRGSGEWVVPAGRFDDAPLWRRLELTGTAYEATEIQFEIEDGELELNGVWLRGTVGLGGELELVVSGREVGGTWRAPEVR